MIQLSTGDTLVIPDGWWVEFEKNEVHVYAHGLTCWAKRGEPLYEFLRACDEETHRLREVAAA